VYAPAKGRWQAAHAERTASIDHEVSVPAASAERARTRVGAENRPSIGEVPLARSTTATCKLGGAGQLDVEIDYPRGGRARRGCWRRARQRPAVAGSSRRGGGVIDCSTRAGQILWIISSNRRRRRFRVEHLGIPRCRWPHRGAPRATSGQHGAPERCGGRLQRRDHARGSRGRGLPRPGTPTPTRVVEARYAGGGADLGHRRVAWASRGGLGQIAGSTRTQSTRSLTPLPGLSAIRRRALRFSGHRACAATRLGG